MPANIELLIKVDGSWVHDIDRTLFSFSSADSGIISVTTDGLATIVNPEAYLSSEDNQTVDLSMTVIATGEVITKTIYIKY